VQGGFVAGMLDSAMAQFILNLHEFKVNPLSLDIDVKYLLPCKPARLEVNAKILKMGKSIAFTSAKLYQDGNLVATATATNKLITLR
jgi:acyl-coenzyme A thioesterase PaaI-like protein